ncbi:MAG: PD-(D/E)XK nuclease family protein [Gammaproteobacteria bacterium]
MEASLLASLDAGTIVVTAHRRQARQIRFRYAAAKQAQHIQAWESPQVMGWDDWLVHLHQDITWSGYSAPRTQRKLLTPFQEQVLWENIIGADDSVMLDDVGGTARKASSAWTLVQSYRLPDPARSPHPNADVAAFGQWMRRYFKRCREQSLMDHARLADSIAPALKAGAIEAPASVLLVGFDGLTPQQRLLLKTLETLGSKLDLYRGARIESQARSVRFPTSIDEYTAVARWVRDILGRDDGGNTAVLVPRLQEDRRSIERIFDDILMPGSSLPGSNLGGRPYNMAVGEAFQRAPLVSTALSICELMRPTLPFDTFSSLLRSPFLRGAAVEAPLRARFEVWLRQQNIARAPVSHLSALFFQFRQRAGQSVDDSVTEALLNGLKSVLSHVESAHRASRWAELFRSLLTACGWPGDSPLDSASFQTAERLRSLLDEMSGLDFLTGTLTVDEALALLRRLARRVTFQPQTPDLPVQILLPEQASGLHFDHLWLCDAHAGTLPEAANPNPFIPLAWQREHSIPGSSARVQLDRAQRLTRGLLRSAGQVVVSAPLTVDDHPVPLSPLVAHLETSVLASLPLAEVTDFQQAIRAATDLETCDDELAPPLPPLVAQSAAPGGSGVFALQAACPFRAFAQLRLRAQPLEEPEPGLNARERGSLIHNALENVWQKLGSSDVLLDLKNSEFLETQIWEITDSALNHIDQRRPLPLAARFRAMEHQRLVRRVLQWLLIEAEREPFDVVRAETRTRVTLGGVSVDLTMDRVDRLAGGALAVIDYKTGHASVGDWFGDRPTQPQLPLYVLAQTEPVGAVAFAFVRPRDGGFAGIGREAGLLPGVEAWSASRRGRALGLSFDDLIGQWRVDLESLGKEYAGGVARVDPKQGACRYCHLPSLCRIGASLDESDQGLTLDAGDGSNV